MLKTATVFLLALCARTFTKEAKKIAKKIGSVLTMSIRYRRGTLVCAFGAMLLLVGAWGCGNESPTEPGSTPGNSIYVVNTDPFYSITAYPKDASGNVPPSVTICGNVVQAGGVALDGTDKIYVTSVADNRVVVYAAGASGDAAPIATLSGNDTGLGGPWDVAVQ